MSNDYKEFAEKDIQSELQKFDIKKLTVITPTIITAEDDTVLLLGREDRFGLKLPSADNRGFENLEQYSPYGLTYRMLNALFADASGIVNPDDFHYLGLLKDRVSAKKHVIVPVLVELDYASNDPRLEVGSNWHIGNQDHPDLSWVSLDEFPDLIANAGKRNDTQANGISDKSATMLQFFLERDTYLEQLTTPSIV